MPERPLMHLRNARRQPPLCNHPHGWENNAIRYVEQHYDASGERPREGHGVITLCISDARAKRAMRRPGSGPIMRPTMGRVDSSADRSVPPGEGLASRRLRPQDKWRTYEPANSAKLDAQLPFALHPAQQGLPRGLLLNLRRIVDRERKMWSIADSAHRRLVLEGRNLVPQSFDLARRGIFGSNVNR